MLRFGGAAASGLAGALVAAFAFVAGFGPPAAGQPPSRTTLDGVFTSEQAERGESAFFANCADCHEIAEFSGPEAMFETERGKSVWPIFDFMWSEMPEDRPAWLEPDEYADILAFLLHRLGMPPGPEELAPDPEALRRLMLVYPGDD